VTYLQEGTPAPCSGYLFSPEKEQEVRLKIIDYDRLTKLTERQSSLIDIQDQRLTGQIKLNQELIEKINNSNQKDFWQNTLYFLSGVLITGAISSAVLHNVR
jgi:hypothetical protein